MKHTFAKSVAVHIVVAGALAGCVAQAPPAAGSEVIAGTVSEHRQRDAFFALELHGIQPSVNQFGDDETIWVWVPKSQVEAAKVVLARFY